MIICFNVFWVIYHVYGANQFLAGYSLISPCFYSDLRFSFYSVSQSIKKGTGVKYITWFECQTTNYVPAKYNGNVTCSKTFSITYNLYCIRLHKRSFWITQLTKFFCWFHNRVLILLIPSILDSFRKLLFVTQT